MTVVQSLSLQNNSCLYPAGKRRKEIGLLDSSRGSAKGIKSWQISECCLNTYLPGNVLFVKQQQKLGGVGGCNGVTWTDKWGVDSRPYVLNSPPETQRTVTGSIWSPCCRIKPPLLGALSAAHIWDSTSPSCDYLSAFPSKLVLSTWQLPSDAGRAQRCPRASGTLMDSSTTQDVTGQPSTGFILHFLHPLPEPLHKVSALSRADSPYLSSLAKATTEIPGWSVILHSKPGQDCINWGRKVNNSCKIMPTSSLEEWLDLIHWALRSERKLWEKGW